MQIKKGASILVLLFVTAWAFPQQKDSARPFNYSLSFGTGWNHYLDNLDYGSKNLNKDFVGFSFRFLWEPEYRLSMGAETGIYTMFNKQSSSPSVVSGKTSRRVTPLLLLVRMRIVDRLYLGAGFGLAMLNNTTIYGSQKIIAKTTSLSNYQFSTSYSYPIGQHLQLGCEAKLFDFGAYNDWMYALQLFCAVRF